MFKCFPAEGFLVPIFESADLSRIPPESLDARLAVGWRHFGTRFFRCNFAIHDSRLCGILPLRISIPAFLPTKSQRRILRKNADLDVRIVPATITDEAHALFHRHKTRFLDNVPDTLQDFLDPQPAFVPCETRAVEIRSRDRLIAVSYLDLGAESASSVYGMFDPDFSSRSLGILTLLHELALAADLGKRHFYLGYSYTVPSPYDYKSRFAPLEAYDWNHGWKPYSSAISWSRPLDEPFRSI